MVRRINENVTDLETLQRLGRARDFIDHCYDHPLSLDQISEKACFSRYHFLRLFRQAFHKTPHQYLIERRIEKAKELLGDHELRVTDVCFEVGFQSLGSFSSLFHKYVGHAPITASLSCANSNPPESQFSRSNSPRLPVSSR
jgi:AraC-like DNA-binding protein